ncbi:MAG TPA: hypothetical protein VNA22_09355 [Pyrinomonadaceae bacterium]|nr:hypothetical protein [Pyrinomonadaceae bacterium]
MYQVAKVFLHVLLAAVTMSIGIAFVITLQLIGFMFAEHPALPAPAGGPAPVLRPLERLGVAPGVLELSCYDPHILPIWSELKKDEQFEQRLDGETGRLNCSEMLEVRRLDLNRDGSEEVIARGKGPDLCSATGNCGFWVFEHENGRTLVLLSGSSYVEANEIGSEILRWSRTRSYDDILLTGHSSAAETSYRTYKFDGRRYAEARCMYQVPSYHSPGGREMEWITCSAYDNRGERGARRAAAAIYDK